MRVLLVSVVAAIAGVASTASANPVECHVINNTGGTADGAAAGGSFSTSAPRTKVVAHGVSVDVKCNKRHPAMALIDHGGKVVAVDLPAWFDVTVDGGTVHVKAPDGAKVTIGGADAAIDGGAATSAVDARALVLAAPFGSAFDPVRGVWGVNVPVHASFKHDSADVFVRVDATPAATALVGELAQASATPVAWAAAPVDGGPAVLVGCWPTAPIAIRGVARLADASLVAVCDRNDSVVASCGAHHSVQLGVIVRLIEAQTGRVVASTGFKGASPPACDAAADHDTTGADVDPTTVLAWVTKQ